MNLFHRFDLGDYQSADQKVQTLPFNPQLFIRHNDCLLTLKWNRTSGQFVTQRFLIDAFQETWTQN